MANDWNHLNNSQDDYIGGALRLLQLSVSGYNRLSVAILQGKMAPHSKKKDAFGLHIWSYADFSASMDNLNNPLAAAFFFLRVRNVKDQTKWQPAAYCLTVGVAASLAPAELENALVDVCGRMRPIISGTNLNIEIMHLGSTPRFKPSSTNLQNFFNALTGPPVPPNPPRLESKSTIDVDGIWTDSGSVETLTWWNVKES